MKKRNTYKLLLITLIIAVLSGCTGQTPESSTLTTDNDTESSAVESSAADENKNTSSEVPQISVVEKSKEEKPKTESKKAETGSSISSELSSQSSAQKESSRQKPVEFSKPTEEEIQQSEEIARRVIEQYPESNINLTFDELAGLVRGRPGLSDEQYAKIFKIASNAYAHIGDYPYQEELVVGTVKETDPKLTLEQLKEILNSVGDRKEYELMQYIKEEIEKIQPYPDFIGGSGTTRWEYWIDANTPQERREEIVAGYTEGAIYYHILNDDGNVVYTERFYEVYDKVDVIKLS